MRSAALSRSLPRLAFVAAVTFGVAGCSSSSNRFDRTSDSSSARPAEDLTGTAQLRPAPQASPQINSVPLLPPPAAQAAPPKPSPSAMTPPPPAPKIAANPPPKTTATPPAITAVPPAANQPTHVVASGDTLHKIARQYNVSVTDLAAANKITAGGKLKSGRQLVIPASTAPLKLAQAKPASNPKPNMTSPADNNPSIRKITPTPDLTPESRDAAQPSLLFRWPVRGRVIAGFGPKPSGQVNHGVNIAVPEGTPVKAAEDGVVVYANSELKSFGNLVLIRHNNGFVTTYAHCSEILVKKDELVKRGQVIAKSGQTGDVTSPQLHFEIRKGQTAVDPITHLERSPQA